MPGIVEPGSCSRQAPPLVADTSSVHIHNLESFLGLCNRLPESPKQAGMALRQVWSLQKDRDKEADVLQKQCRITPLCVGPSVVRLPLEVKQPRRKLSQCSCLARCQSPQPKMLIAPVQPRLDISGRVVAAIRIVIISKAGK